MTQKMSVFVVGFCCLLFMLAGHALAQTAEPSEQPSNLTLWNFFTEGWSQEWTHRSNHREGPRTCHSCMCRRTFWSANFGLIPTYQENLSNDSNKGTLLHGCPGCLWPKQKVHARSGYPTMNGRT